MQIRLTGGAANSNVVNSRGGAMSSVEVTSGAINNLWDNVGGTESRDGRVEYRCVAIYNAHGTATMINTKCWILSDTTSPGDEVDIALSTTPVGSGDESINTVSQSETTLPGGAGVLDFQHKNSDSNSLNPGDIGPGQRAYIWIRRTVQPGAAAQPNNNYILRVTCETT